MRTRLSLLLFLQYAPLGAILPLYSLHCERLQFSRFEVGLACAAQAAGALAALAGGQVADRWLPAQRCLTVCAGLAAVLLWFMAGLTAPWAFIGVSLAFWVLMIPAGTFSIAVCFAHLEDPARRFGPVRLWGTVGWVVGLMAGSSWVDETSGLRRAAAWLGVGMDGDDWGGLFRLAALLSLAFGAYALTLPHTPPQRCRGSWLAPLGAIRLMGRRAFAVCCFCYLGVWLTQPFTSQVTALLLNHLGIPPRWLGPALSIQQSTEIVSLAILPLILRQLGPRWTMLVGLGAWTLALVILAVGRPVWLVIGSQGLNGLLICCFVIAAQVYANDEAPDDLRASVQAWLQFLTGMGVLGGNLLVGLVREGVEGAFAPTFAVGAGMAAGLFLVFLVGFPSERRFSRPGAMLEGSPSFQRRVLASRSDA